MREQKSFLETLPLLDFRTALTVKDTLGRSFGEKRVNPNLPLVPTQFTDSRIGGYTNSEAFEAYFSNPESTKRVFGFLAWLQQNLYPQILKNNAKENKKFPKSLRRLQNFVVFLAVIEHLPNLLYLYQLDETDVVFPSYLTAGVKIAGGILKTIALPLQNYQMLEHQGINVSEHFPSLGELGKLSGEKILDRAQRHDDLLGNEYKEWIGKKRSLVTEVCPAPSSMIVAAADILLGTREQVIPPEVAQELSLLFKTDLNRLVQFTNASRALESGKERLTDRLGHIDFMVLQTVGIDTLNENEIQSLTSDGYKQLVRNKLGRTEYQKLVARYDKLSEKPDKTISQLMNSLAIFLVAEAPELIAAFNKLLSNMSAELPFDIEPLTMDLISKCFGIVSPDELIQAILQINEIVILPENKRRIQVEFRKKDVETLTVELKAPNKFQIILGVLLLKARNRFA